jgi:hypothetical protein
MPLQLPHLSKEDNDRIVNNTTIKVFSTSKCGLVIRLLHIHLWHQNMPYAYIIILGSHPVDGV